MSTPDEKEKAAGHRLDWALIAQKEEDRQILYHARDLAVMRGDLSELTNLFNAALHRNNTAAQN